MDDDVIGGGLSVVVIGDLNFDVIVDVESVEAPIQALWREARQLIHADPGGAGLHIAQAAASAGVPVTLFARVGADRFGEILLRQLQSSGVDPCVAVDSRDHTGIVLILRDADDRRVMISSRGANIGLEPVNIDTTKLSRSSVLFVSGYALLEGPQSRSAIYAVQCAKEQGARVVLDLVPHRILRNALATEYRQALDACDVVVSETGTARRVFTEAASGSDEELAHYLLRRYELVVLRPTNDVQLVGTGRTVRPQATGYSQAANRVGYLDAIAVTTVIEQLGLA